MSVYPLNEIFQYKESDVAVFLGSGPSINEITSEQWEKIKSLDKWTVNNWVYHPFIVPDFYHIEAKKYDYEIIKARIDEKRRLYRNVKYIFRRGRGVKKEDGIHVPLRSVIGEMSYIFEYDVVIRGSKHSPTPYDANYIIDKERLTLSYAVSLPLIIELIYKFGYKFVVFYGIDLYDSRYFWTGGDPKYGKVHHQTNKEHEGKDPELPHNTYKLKDFIVDFNKRWFLPYGREMFVGHKKTLLYPELRCIDIKSLVSN